MSNYDKYVVFNIKDWDEFCKAIRFLNRRKV